jgi:hypothetical protein
LTCRQPFEGAEGNLQRLMGRNMQWLEEHCNSQNHEVEDILSIHHVEHIHRLIARFLLLIDIWFFDKTLLIESHQVRFYLGIIVMLKIISQATNLVEQKVSFLAYGGSSYMKTLNQTSFHMQWIDRIEFRIPSNSEWFSSLFNVCSL